jgi:hypothetical protein
MHTVIVTYKIDRDFDRQKLIEMFSAASPMFQNASGLVRKYFCFQADISTGKSVYLFESRNAADDFFSEAFLQQMEKLFGNRPEAIHLDTLMIIDNAAGTVTPNF